MTPQIVYRHRMEYDTKVAGVVLPVVLLANDSVAAVNAAVDTGSTLCVFQHEIAERLGIRVEGGIEDYISAMGTIIKVYGHEVTLVLEDLSMDLIVYFPAYQ